MSLLATWPSPARKTHSSLPSSHSCRPAGANWGVISTDLLVDSADTRQLCFVERWDDAAALDQHLATNHVKNALGQIEGLVEAAPEIRRYTLV